MKINIIQQGQCLNLKGHPSAVLRQKNFFYEIISFLSTYYANQIVHQLENLWAIFV